MKKKTIFVMLGCFVLKGLDFFSTYALDPHLNKELNPLITYWKWGWAGALLYQLIVLGLILGCYIWSQRIETSDFFPQSEMTKTNFSIFYYLGRTARPSAVLTQSPRNMRVVVKIFGNWIMLIFMAMTLYAVVSNSLLLFVSRHFSIFEITHKYHPLLVLIGTGLYLRYFFESAFIQYQNNRPDDRKC